LRIQKIEVVGFKSFADREVVVVDERVTGVIGPNGCGKSNIVDAMRWCMGEQSAKHLRGTGMADVIFAGCASRGPAGMAEVTLTFERDARDVDLPPLWQEYSEISVSRRLYNDGESEYLINKIPCRLRDVTDLFMGTGVGTKAYSIIEQGQVGKIVSSKPENRRHIIDEAAGITRFKTQKLAAERKIEQTRQNLLRVQDVVGELEVRLGTLRRQAQKAERYKRYRSELRDLELWMASHRFLELGATLRVLDERRSDLAEQVETLRNAAAAREAELAARKLAFSQAEQLLQTHQQRVYDLDNRIQLLEAEQQFRRREQDNLRDSIAQSRAETQVVTRNLDSLRDERHQLGERVRALGDPDGQDVRKAVQTHEAALSQQDVCAAAVGQRVEQLRSEQARLQSDAAGVDARVQSRREAIAELEQRVCERSSELESFARELGEAQRTLEHAHTQADQATRALERLRVHRGELDRERASLRGLVQSAEVELDTTRAELHRCRSRLQSLQEIESRYRSCASGVQVIMAHREHVETAHGTRTSDVRSDTPQAVLGIMADYISAPQHLEAAVSAALGDRLQGVIVDQPSAGARGVELLKREQEGRIAFLPRSCREAVADSMGASSGGWRGHEGVPVGWSRPERSSESMQVVDLSSPERLPGVLGRLIDLVQVEHDVRPLARVLLGDALVVEGLPRALELWQAKTVSGTLVTLDGDRVEQSGVVVGGSPNALDSALLQQKREIRELESIAEQLTCTFEAARARHLGLAERAAELDDARERSESEVLAGETTRLSCTQRVEQLVQQIARINAQQVSTGNEHDKLRKLLDERHIELTSLCAESKRISVHLPVLRDELGLAHNEAAELAFVRSATVDGLTEAKVALARWQHDHDTLEQAGARIDKQLASEHERLRRLGHMAEDAQRRIAELEGQGAEASRQRLALVEDNRQAAGQMHDAREAYDAARIAVDELDLAIRNLRGELDEQREQLKDVDLGIQELRLELSHLERDVFERFDTPLHGVLIDHHDRPLAGERELERQRELKQILSRMGEVSLTAIDECEQVSARYDHLSSQQHDLHQALVQLEEAIEKINKTTRQRFKDTFELVNEKFQQMFPRLFAGGSAKLVLTDPHNLLDTGVDIVAQPPGKQLRSLDLLSGGEKALTAVSLVFAIFLIKPSPFCLLDEVDAPLDDANVERFCKLVAELSNDTQFVIITHNKRTMETADRLYGVTMEQRGVSKLVSVNLHRAVELAHAS